MKNLARLFISVFFSVSFITACKKTDVGCISDMYLPNPTYSNPVWHPGGKLLGFNYLPLAGKQTAGTPPCTSVKYLYKYDSAGFWLSNTDGTNKHMALHIMVESPAWSPDGKWMAFAHGGVIYKIPFDGNNFDTTAFIQLTTGPYDGNPYWSDNGKLIYFNGEKDGITLANIFVINADGTNLQRITQQPNGGGGMYPSLMPGDKLLFVSWTPGATGYTEVFEQDIDGSNLKQLTNTQNAYRSKQNPRYYSGKIYYQENGIYMANTDGGNVKQLVSSTTQLFSISKTGVIAYINFDYTKLDKTTGSIWIMNADGSNKRPLTFNN